MDRPLPSVLGVAIAAIALCFSVCGDAAPVEHVQSADIERALTGVSAARPSADADPLALEEALTAQETRTSTQINTHQPKPPMPRQCDRRNSTAEARPSESSLR